MRRLKVVVVVVMMTGLRSNCDEFTYQLCFQLVLQNGLPLM